MDLRLHYGGGGRAAGAHHARARDLPRLVAEFEAARRHFGLPATTPIRTCYEAGRDGFRALRPADAGWPSQKQS